MLPDEKISFSFSTLHISIQSTSKCVNTTCYHRSTPTPPSSQDKVITAPRRHTLNPPVVGQEALILVGGNSSAINPNQCFVTNKALID